MRTPKMRSGMLRSAAPQPLLAVLAVPFLALAAGLLAVTGSLPSPRNPRPCQDARP